MHRFRQSLMPRNRAILEMHYAGASRFEIAVHFKISHDQAHRICRLMKGGGKPFNGPKEKKERNAQIKRLRKKGRTTADIASLFRIAEMTVRDILRHEKPYDGPLWRDIQARRLH
jgi:DNA-binding CsgD family transcriptional regulator